MAIDRAVHQGEVLVGGANNLRRSKVGSIRKRCKSNEVDEKDRNFSFQTFGRISEPASRQCDEPGRRQIAASGAVQPPEECAVAHRPLAEDYSECEVRGDDRISHR